MFIIFYYQVFNTIDDAVQSSSNPTEKLGIWRLLAGVEGARGASLGYSQTFTY
jgi:hypothetical protein